jgi:hypothetical protein
MFGIRGRRQPDVTEPNVIILEASEIASISIRTIEVFLYGPKPKLVEWLVIEPSQIMMQSFSGYVRPLLKADDPGKQAYIANEEGRLTMEWKWCRPALPVFLQQVAQVSPTIVIGPEERSELDLNGVWHGPRGGPDAQQRRMLVQAKRLGFSRKCVELLSLCRGMTRQEAAAYLAEIEEGEAGTDISAVQTGCGRGR